MIIKTVTSVTIWNDAVGKRMSVTYSEVDSETGAIISDNKRLDRVVTDSETIATCDDLMAYAQDFIDNK